MTPEEFEQKFEGQAETPNLDFKGDVPWDVRKLAKDILAMTNLRDGGAIVIGVGERNMGFVKDGVSEENLATYKVDEMKDQLLSFADPSVDIYVQQIESEDKKFVVINVHPFQELPVISRKQIDGVIAANTIYYRNSNKRVESAPISNSTDFRDLIELAAVRLMQKRKDYGYSITQGLQDRLDNELKKIETNKFLDKIKSNGYWEIIFQPVEEKHVPLIQILKSTIEKAQVKKDWYFPVIPFVDDEKNFILNSNDFYGATSDLGRRKEYWRIYKSGQFIYYSALTEDWYHEDQWMSKFDGQIQPGHYVTMFTSIIYEITAAIDFLNRLVTQDFFTGAVRIKMSLNNVKERMLYPDSSGRYGFIKPKKTNAEIILLEEEVSTEKLIINHLAISNKLIFQVFDAFGYNPDPATILVDQDRYITGTN